MTTETVFDQHVIRVKRLTFVRALNRLLLATAFVFLCGYTVMTILERVTHVPFEATPGMYAGLAAGAFVLAAIYILVTRVRLLDILIDVDARLKLRDRLSTAYEYRTQRKSSEFFDLLIADAGQRLSSLSRSQLFPFRFSRLHLLILLVLLLNVLLSGLDRLPRKNTALPMDPHVSEQIQKAIEEYLVKNQEQEQQTEAGQKAREQFREQLEKMSKQLEQQTMTRKQMIEALRENLKEIQSQRDKLTQELETELKKLDSIRDLPIREMPQLQQLSSQQLNKIEKMFGQALDGELPENIRQDMDMLRQYQDMKGMLDEMLDDAERNRQEGVSPEQGQQRRANPGPSQADQNRMSDEEMNNAMDFQPSNGAPSEEDGKLGQENQGQPFSGMEGEDLDNEPQSPAPGDSPGDGSQYPPSAIERASDSPLQDRMAPSKKAEYSKQIRSVTTIGNADVPREDVTRAYEQEVESILQKEDVPLNYREYIKTYFMSIGLTNEE